MMVQQKLLNLNPKSKKFRTVQLCVLKVYHIWQNMGPIGQKTGILESFIFAKNYHTPKNILI